MTTKIQKLVRKIVVLTQQHAVVVFQLVRTVRDEAPELADRWAELHRVDFIDRTSKPPRHPEPLELWGRAAEMMCQHPRYGYVARWAFVWWCQAEALKSEAIAEIGGDPKKLYALMNAEARRRRGEART